MNTGKEVISTVLTFPKNADKKVYAKFYHYKFRTARVPTTGDTIANTIGKENVWYV
jgi:hypothetical protein